MIFSDLQLKWIDRRIALLSLQRIQKLQAISEATPDDEWDAIVSKVTSIGGKIRAYKEMRNHYMNHLRMERTP